MIRLASFCLLALLVLLALGCRPGTRVLARVGSYEILQKDADFKDKIVEIYYPGTPQGVGLQQLVEAFTYAEILRNNGYPITDDVLAAEESRINQNTKWPERLLRIKDVFGSDSASYRKDFVLPVLAGRSIYADLFLHSPKIQAETQKEALRFLRAAQAHGASFAEVARRDGLALERFSVSAEKGVINESLQPPSILMPENEPNGWVHTRLQVEAQREAKSQNEFWVESLAKRMKAGEIWSQILDRDNFWQVIRYLGKQGALYRFESVHFPKLDYQNWLLSEKSKVKVEILN